MPRIALEVGRRYRTRNGKAVTIIDKHGIREFIFQADNTRLYDPDGNFSLKSEDEDHPEDIIELIGEDTSSQDHFTSSKYDIVIDCLSSEKPIHVQINYAGETFTTTLKNLGRTDLDYSSENNVCSSPS